VCGESAACNALRQTKPVVEAVQDSGRTWSRRREMQDKKGRKMGNERWDRNGAPQSVAQAGKWTQWACQ